MHHWSKLKKVISCGFSVKPTVIEGERGAAKILDLHPNTLRSRMKKLGVERGH
jgi:transcriptional regulator with GAF, ATPase, and Fis domain